MITAIVLATVGVGLIVAALRRCRHIVYIEDIHRFDENTVGAPCAKCGKLLSAPYGLALPATLDQKYPANG